MQSGAQLANQDVAGNDMLSAELLDTPALCLAIPSVT